MFFLSIIKLPTWYYATDDRSIISLVTFGSMLTIQMSDFNVFDSANSWKQFQYSHMRVSQLTLIRTHLTKLQLYSSVGPWIMSLILTEVVGMCNKTT